MSKEITKALEDTIKSILHELSGIAGEMSEPYRARAIQYKEIVQLTWEEVRNGTITPDAGAANINRVWNATKSDLISAAYEIQIRRMDIVNAVLPSLLKLVFAVIKVVPIA